MLEEIIVGFFGLFGLLALFFYIASPLILREELVRKNQIVKWNAPIGPSFYLLVWVLWFWRLLDSLTNLSGLGHGTDSGDPSTLVNIENAFVVAVLATPLIYLLYLVFVRKRHQHMQSKVQD